MELKLGIKGSYEYTVEFSMTAKALGSGGHEVLSTPYMIAMMEGSCLYSVAPCLAEGEDTVGTHVDVSHLAATPIGARIRTATELIEIDRRKLTFKVQSFCGDELIGEGTHERAIINTEKFMAKCCAKKS